jgi:hypothetical protein
MYKNVDYIIIKNNTFHAIIHNRLGYCVYYTESLVMATVTCEHLPLTIDCQFSESHLKKSAS